VLAGRKVPEHVLSLISEVLVLIELLSPNLSSMINHKTTALLWALHESQTPRLIQRIHRLLSLTVKESIPSASNLSDKRVLLLAGKHYHTCSYSMQVHLINNKISYTIARDEPGRYNPKWSDSAAESLDFQLLVNRICLKNILSRVICAATAKKLWETFRKLYWSTNASTEKHQDCTVLFGRNHD